MKRYGAVGYSALMGLTLLAGCSENDRIMRPTGAQVAGDARLAALTPVASQSNGTMIHGLTVEGELIAFDAANPADIVSRVEITGLDNSSTFLLGIDFRPATGQLYGLANSSRLYTIDASTGIATPVGPAFTPALSGTSFGFDFNPAVDRIRIVSDTGQNLRAHPETGAVVSVDGSLAYDLADPNAGREPAVVGGAYTNPDNDPLTGTTLYDIDRSWDLLVTQNPPNSGTLNTVGGLGFDIGRLLGFDITLDNGSNVAFVAIKSTGSDREGGGRSGRDRLNSANHLLRVDLNTGRATDLGRIGGSGPVNGIAVAVPQPELDEARRAPLPRVAPVGFDSRCPGAASKVRGLSICDRAGPGTSRMPSRKSPNVFDRMLLVMEHPPFLGPVTIGARAFYRGKAQGAGKMVHERTAESPRRGAPSERMGPHTKEVQVAGRGNPSFLKNQKAKKRAEKATAKRSARQARKAEKAAERAAGTPPVEEMAPITDEPEA